MTVTIGPYEFKRARFYPGRDWLDLDNRDGDLAVCEHDTADGDRWFSRLDDPDKLTGIEIEFVVGRSANGLTVQLPTGERVAVTGVERIIEASGQT